MKPNWSFPSPQVVLRPKIRHQQMLMAVWLAVGAAWPMVSGSAPFWFDNFSGPQQSCTLTNAPATCSTPLVDAGIPFGLSRQLYLRTTGGPEGPLSIAANVLPGFFTYTSAGSSNFPTAPDGLCRITWYHSLSGLDLSGVDTVQWDYTNSQSTTYLLTLSDTAGRSSTVPNSAEAGWSGRFTVPLSWFDQLGVDLTSVESIRLEIDPALFGQVAIDSVGFYIDEPDTGIDIGLRMFDGSRTNKIACERPGLGGSLTSPLRIARNGTNYGILLVDTNATDASRIQVRTASGVKAWKKLP